MKIIMIFQIITYLGLDYQVLLYRDLNKLFSNNALEKTGDAMYDSNVRFDDYIELLMTFLGKYSTNPGESPNLLRLRSDFNGNGFVDNDDKRIFDMNYNPDNCSVEF